MKPSGKSRASSIENMEKIEKARKSGLNIEQGDKGQGMSEGVDAGLRVNFDNIVDYLKGGGEATLSLILAFGDRVSEGSVLDASNDFGVAIAKGEGAGLIRGPVDGDFVIFIIAFGDEGTQGFSEVHIEGMS